MRKLFPVILLSLIFSSGCSSSNNNSEISETKSELVTLSIEEESQLQFCNLVEKAYKSYENSGMSYETRDIFGEAYDVIHELLGTSYSSRYSDYNFVMADHSYAYGPNSNINDVVEILGWCEDTKTLLEEKSIE
jgi:hypothetical protein